jgi:hypothetical protein
MIDVVFADNGPQPGVEQRSARSDGGMLYDKAVRRGMKGCGKGDAISFGGRGGRGRVRVRGGHRERRRGGRRYRCGQGEDVRVSKSSQVFVLEAIF